MHSEHRPEGLITDSEPLEKDRPDLALGQYSLSPNEDDDSALISIPMTEAQLQYMNRFHEDNPRAKSKEVWDALLSQEMNRLGWQQR
jgi:hypothetical protein